MTLPGKGGGGGVMVVLKNKTEKKKKKPEKMIMGPEADLRKEGKEYRE